MDADITEDELRVALSTCADSAPGSDGIPYGVYKLADRLLLLKCYDKKNG